MYFPKKLSIFTLIVGSIFSDYIISERELTFVYAICYHPSVCLSVVCNVRAPYVRSFVIAGRGPAYSGPQRQPRERRGIGRCVRCMRELCRVEEGLSRREQLVRYF